MDQLQLSMHGENESKYHCPAKINSYNCYKKFHWSFCLDYKGKRTGSYKYQWISIQLYPVYHIISINWHACITDNLVFFTAT